MHVILVSHSLAVLVPFVRKCAQRANLPIYVVEKHHSNVI